VSTDRKGFTFLEILVSLAVITTIAVVVFHAYVGVERVTHEVRLLEESSLLASRIPALSFNEKIREPGDWASGWEVKMQPVELTQGTTTVTWAEWAFRPAGDPVYPVPPLYLLLSESTDGHGE
jgi:prepilin-type N-terminal cleavage/methylation domain-containing protein